MHLSFIEVGPDNVVDHGLCCVANRKSPGFKSKLEWFRDVTNIGTGMVIALDQSTEKQVGFVEYTDSELAWRPVKAENQLFIHCITVFSKSSRNQETGSRLIREVERIALGKNKQGVCVMTSDGVWMAGKSLFEKNGYSKTDQSGRFELMWKPLVKTCKKPELINWEQKLPAYSGWHLLYSDQCPWHIKSASDISDYATSVGININVAKLSSPIEAQNGPSGYGTFALIKDGKLLADHYISRTRFINILKKELEKA